MPALSQQELAVRMHVLICRHWTATLREPYDWGEHPLGAYLLTEEFLESMSRCPPQSLRQATWVCAMLACGRVDNLRAAGARQRTDRMGGKLVRTDGCTGWECPLGRSRDQPRLRYWLHADGTVEFEALVYADNHATCMRERLREPRAKRRPI